MWKTKKEKIGTISRTKNEKLVVVYQIVFQEHEDNRIFEMNLRSEQRVESKGVYSSQNKLFGFFSFYFFEIL